MADIIIKANNRTSYDVINAVVNEYVNGNLPVKQLCEKYNTSLKTIKKWVIQSGNPLRVDDFQVLNNAVNEYINSKKSLRYIAKKIGVCKSTLRMRLIKLGYECRDKNECKHDNQIIKECCELYNNGVPNKELSEKYNVSRTVISNWLKNSGIKLRKYNETLGISNELKDKAKELYIKDNLNACEISRILGVSSHSILDWVKDSKRSKSETATINIIKNGASSYWNTKKGDIDTVFGKIHYDSGYERDRINQLVKDENILFLGRCQDVIKYQGNDSERCYAPDLYIKYKDGREIVEEVKPFTYIKKFNNLNKFKSAKKFYKTRNIVFRVVTETKIYGKRFLKNKVLTTKTI
jgi:transposase-like protein